MNALRERLLSGAIALGLGLALAACGGGGGGTAATGSTAAAGSTPVVAAADNVVSVVVDAGPNDNSANTLFTTVTICVPGSTTQCQTIDHIQVDTGSYGLRILAPVLSVTLPVTVASDNVSTLVECTQFVDGYSWGPVAAADLTMSGETANNLPVQVIGDSRFPTVPADCSGMGVEEDTVAAFGANGILGIGVFEQDCGQQCTLPPTSSPYYYYACSATACTPTAASLTTQVLNPVPLFAADNNGTIISLPSVANGGAATLTGSLIFGIDTQANNASGSQTVLTLDGSGYFTTMVDDQTLSTSFIDSGSNALFFNDSVLTDCTDKSFSGFYCPTSTQSFTATLQGNNGIGGSVVFSIGNAETVADAQPTFTAFPILGGTYPSSDSTFDWGLPFFYGRRVANAIENHPATSVGTGPYVAY